jgi:hypothetical protein
MVMDTPSGLPGGEALMPMAIEEDNNLVAMEDGLDSLGGEELAGVGKAQAPPPAVEQARAVQAQEDRPLQAGEQMYILDMGWVA